MDASNVSEAYRKQILQNKELEKALVAATNAGAKGYEQLAKSLNDNNQATKKLIQEKDKLKAKIDEMKKAQQEQGSVSSAVISGMASGFTQHVLPALEQAISLQAEYNKQLAQEGRLRDDLLNKVQTQLGIGDEQFAGARDSMYRIAYKTASTEEQTARTAKLLGGEGVAPELATGAILEEILTAGVATTADDPAEFGKAVAGVLKAKGMDMTLENFQSVTTPVAAAWKAANLEAQDLPALAGVMSVTKDISPMEDIAAFGTLRNVGMMAPEKAATAYRSIVSRFQNLKADKPSYDALSKVADGLGVNVDKMIESFDFRGESFGQGIANFKSVMDKLDPETKSGVMKQIVGDEGLAGLSTIVSQQGQKQYEAFMAGSTDRKSMEENFKIRTSGAAAAQRRNEIMRAQALFDETQKAAADETYFENLNLAAEKVGTPAIARAAMDKGVRWTYGIGNALGLLDKPADLLGMMPGSSGATMTLDMMQQQAYAPGTMIEGQPTNTTPLVMAPNLVPQDAKGGLNINLRDRGEVKSPELEAAEIRKQELELEVQRLKLAASEAGSPRGDKTSKKEEKFIDAAQRLVDQQAKLVDEIKLANDKRQQTKRNNPNR